MTQKQIERVNALVERKTWAEDILECMAETRKLTLRFSFGREASAFTVPLELREVIEEKVREMKEAAEKELESI